jgi:butyryl-CoA dehydrogenase
MNYVNMRNLNFWLHELHPVADLLQYEKYQDFDLEAFNLMIQSAKDLADAEMFPFFKEMDENPVKYEDGTIKVHPQLKRIIELSAENGWIGATAPFELGGMQLPEMIYTAANHIFHAANNGALGYVNLTTGAARLITTFGSQDLIDTYVPKMFGGQWQGTMALTEPQAGSSLSDIVSSAKLNEDGSYSIKGQKIFISAGDHTACDNIVHLLLARIEGAPAGTKGISLFVVPKFRPTADGGLEPNDVITAGEFKKLGQKAYATAHLVYGDQGDCKGWLVGQANKGLSYMFQMMNEARLSVGLMAASTATAAYHASLQYATERPQGRPLNSRDPFQAPCLIIEHPDVRRMLLLQKALTEGSMSLVMECAKLADLVTVTEGEQHQAYHQLLEMLIPICKTYPSEAGITSISQGLQILGGYGYTTDFPLQVYYRDIRIMSIYEGTTGIQSLDLLGRKVTMENGAAARKYFEVISGDIAGGMAIEAVQPEAKLLAEALQSLQAVTMKRIEVAMQGDNEKFLADATLYMEMFSIITVAWQWLKMGSLAAKQIDQAAGEDERKFYASKLHTMRFYFAYELPKIKGLAHKLSQEQYLTLPSASDLVF